MNVLLIGSGARELAIARALGRSPKQPSLYVFGPTHNPFIHALAAESAEGDLNHLDLILKLARQWHIELAIIGPEYPLKKGLADAFWKANIPTIGPKQQSAQIETSKGFARQLLTTHSLPASPRYAVFHDLTNVRSFLKTLGEHHYVIKPDGLTGGKGVKVADVHLHSLHEAYAYCETLHAAGHSFLIEEKLHGLEFSLMCFSDGTHTVSMPVVQDFKRAWPNDLGPNTGSMGSYSDANHRLPFLTQKEVEHAQWINEGMLHALKKETGESYIGIVYGSFIATQQGIQLIEFNARFGDPEAINVLSILESDFLDICEHMIDRTLSESLVRFSNLATVCKYAVPMGYPENPLVNERVDIHQLNPDSLYLASVREHEGRLYTTHSRTAAVVGIAATIQEAEERAEHAIQQLSGPLYHRADIGTSYQIAPQHQSQLRLCILGGTKGSAMLAIAEAIQNKTLSASIEVVISNQEHAVILERAQALQLKTAFIPDSGTFEKEVSILCQQHAVDVIVLIGFMRILSPQFVETWHQRIINIHPSLLPHFAKKKDEAVHQAVLQSGHQESGCTVHFVTEEVDAGPILLQKKCGVYSDDTVTTLKQRVQSLERKTLVSALQQLTARARPEDAASTQ